MYSIKSSQLSKARLNKFTQFEKKKNNIKRMFKVMFVKYIDVRTHVSSHNIFCESDLIFITLCLSNEIVMMLSSTNCERI